MIWGPQSWHLSYEYRLGKFDYGPVTQLVTNAKAYLRKAVSVKNLATQSQPYVMTTGDLEKLDP